MNRLTSGEGIKLYSDVYIEKKGLLNKLRNKKELLVITEEEIEKIPYDALFAILQEYFDFYYKSLKMGE